MEIGRIITKEYISLFGFLMLFLFVVTNKKIERFDKKLYFGVIIAAIVEILVFEIENYLSRLSYPTFMRIVLSSLGYLIRPLLVLIIILLVDKNLRTRKNIFLLSIPLIICLICVSTAFYSHLIFGIMRKTIFKEVFLDTFLI